jgi:hypothetical protein
LIACDLQYRGSHDPDKKSFSVNVPAGWIADQQAAKRFGAVFVLVPPGTSFNNAAAIIIGSSYKGISVADAIEKTRSQTRSRDPAAQMTELPAVTVGTARFSVLEIRSKVGSQPFETVACVTLGQDVLVLTLSALAEVPYSRAGEIFTAMLKSYQDTGLEIKVVP